MSTLKDLYFGQLKDLYDAEQRLVKAIPKMAEESNSKELQTAFQEHLEETQEQVRRLEEIFSLHGMNAERETCKAMMGLIEEGEKEMEEWDEAAVKDAAIIASGQRVEHYEIAGYGSAKCFAELLGFAEDAELLNQSLQEEKAADEKLNEIALGSVNVNALLGEESDQEVEADTKQGSGKEKIKTQRSGVPQRN